MIKIPVAYNRVEQESESDTDLYTSIHTCCPVYIQFFSIHILRVVHSPGSLL